MQFALNLIVYALIARSYIVPRLSAVPLQAALTPLLLFHTLRTVGMVFVVGAVVEPKLPRDFAVGAAYGDLLAVLLRRSWRRKRANSNTTTAKGNNHDTAHAHH